MEWEKQIPVESLQKCDTGQWFIFIMHFLLQTIIKKRYLDSNPKLDLQWNLGLRTPRFTFVSVYVWRFVQNVAPVYVQNFGLRTLICEF